MLYKIGKMKNIVLVLVFVFSSSLQAQQLIKGRVFDAQTREPLAFANIIYDRDKGVVADFDGNFMLSIPPEFDEFTVSYIGYQTETVRIHPSQKFYTVFLKPAVEQLQAVVIQGDYVNPALELIKKAIQHKKQNNYQTALKKYAYTKYIKFLIGAEVDKIDKLIDTIYINGKFHRVDSSLFDFKKEFSNKHAWIVENVAKVNAQNGKEKAEIIATRTAGLKKPFYEFIAISLSAQNPYDDQYKMLFKPFLGPLSRKSLKTYRYEIEDTVVLKNRPVIVVAYKSKQKPLVSGKLYIDKENLALARFTLNTFEELQYNADYRFDYYPEENIWFPKQVNIRVKKAENKNEINLDDKVKMYQTTNDTVYINSRGDTIRYTREKGELDYVFVQYHIKYFDILLHQNYPEKIAYSMQVSPLATKRSRAFWEKMRGEKYTSKELNTYHAVDSAVQAEKIDFYLYKYKRILDGYYPLTQTLDLALKNLLDYNRYEGFRIKLGIRTNENFSQHWQINAYGAYGFKDQAFKYSGSLQYKLHHPTQTYLKIGYTDDLEKYAAFNFHQSANPFQTEIHYAHDKFIRFQSASFSVSHLISPQLKTDVTFSKTLLSNLFSTGLFNSRLQPAQINRLHYNISIEWTPFTRYFLAPEGRKIRKDGSPKFYLDFEQNIPQWSTDSARYFRLQFQTYYKKTHVNAHYTELFLRFGFASRHATLDRFFAPLTNNYPGSNPLERFNLTNHFAFETMNDLEFADHFLATAHLQHTFSKIKLGPRKTFDIRLLFSGAYGWSYPSYSINTIQSLNRFYWEAGTEFKRILRTFGLGFYYRLGAYSHPQWLDNLSIRLTVDFPLEELFNTK